MECLVVYDLVNCTSRVEEALGYLKLYCSLKPLLPSIINRISHGYSADYSPED